MALENALLDILVCPIDKRGLLYFADDAVLYNPRLRRLYRIEDGIPLMLASQAVPGTRGRAQPADEVRRARRGHRDHGGPGRHPGRRLGPAGSFQVGVSPGARGRAMAADGLPRRAASPGWCRRGGR